MTAEDLQPRFLLDQMLGRLTRWLRVLGYDAEYGTGETDDDLLQRAERDSRVLLTRDTLLMERRAVARGRVQALLIRHDLLVDQLAQLRVEVGLRVVGRPRCLVCNGELFPISRAAARRRVPLYVARTQNDFRYCPHCNRVVWPGTHWERMRETLRQAGIDPAELGGRCLGREGGGYNPERSS